MDDGNLKIFACNLRRALVTPEECDIPWMLETAARELDRLRILQTAADELDRLRTENERLKTAIREHRDQKSDDRCWLDDMEPVVEV
jgi:RPA family protein